jgi:hypothetical protein
MNIPDLVIREIRARPVVAPLPRPIRTASGDVLDAPLLLIDVLTDVGVTGRAYAFAYTPLTLRSLAQFACDIAPELIGKQRNLVRKLREFLESPVKLVLAKRFRARGHMRRLFEEACGIGTDVNAVSGGLAAQFSLNLGLDVHDDSHGRSPALPS